MNQKILNRNFQHPGDGWYHIEVKGHHPNREAGVVQVIDDEACGAIVNRFNADADTGALSHGHEMLIDHEHFKHDAGKETVAYGWLQQLDNRPDGYYGKIRWTGTGQSAVDSGDYRFFSTEYDPADLTVLNTNGKKRTVRPLRLDGLTLTNDPNNRGAKPITNRSLPKAPADGCCPACNVALHSTGEAETCRCPQCQTHFSGAGAPANPTTKAKTMKNVASKLGLVAESSEESILAAVTTLLNRVSALEGEITPLRNRKRELETENQTLLGEQVDGILFDHKITDAKIVNRIKPLLLPLGNRSDRMACLADLGFRAGETVARPAWGGGRVLNRGGKPPEVETDADGREGQFATKVMNRAQALVKDTPNLSLATAVTMAREEIGK